MRRQLSWVLAIVMFLGVLNAGLPGSGGGGHTAYADAQVTAATYKIPVTPTMVKNESAYGDPSKLFDQQTVAGDPKGGTGGAADSSFWFGYWGAATESVYTNYPAYAYIDLGQTYKLTDVYLRDRDTKGDFTVYTGTPAGSGNWTEQFTDDLCDVSCSTYSSYAWKGHTIDNVETRYVRFKMASRDSAVSEIVLYGIPVPAKIPLSPVMVTNESGYGDATRLVDEQATAGDPLNGAGGAPNKFWFGAWEESYNPASTSYPAYAYIDLGRSYNLSHIFLYDYNDPGAWDNASASFNVYTGSPGSWTLAFDATHSGSSSGWLSRSMNGVVTRYVRVESSRLAAVMSEIVLYGSPADAVLPPQIPLNISMVTYDVAGAMNAYTLVDDQSAVGDPLRGSTVSDWSKLHAWTDWSGNAYINLGQNYKVDNLFLGDYTGTGTVNIYTGSGDPVVWTQFGSEMQNSYGAWNRHPIGVTTQQLRIQKLGGGQISEIVLYGTPVPKPILLADTMVHNISGYTNPTLMVNQQAQAGDPLNGSLPGAADAVAAANVTTTSYPAEAYIDLGSPYVLTNIALLDGDDLAASGQGVQVYAGAPGSWNAQPLFTDRMLNRAQWNMHPVSVTTQYVRVVKTSGNANFSEIVLYGTRVGGALKDETPPAAVTDLTTTAVGSIAATLQWTAPGDSGTAGTAASYEVRYSTSNITADNFSAATLVANAPAPLGAGTKQTMTISGLTPETTYYFALKTKDGAGNISALSNVLSRTMNAVDNTAPGAVTNLAAAYVSGNAVRLTWTAPGDDGATGTATSYALRYSTSDITTGNWTSATAAGFVPIPAAAGKQQSAWVYGLNPSTSYKFAIRATDEAGNVAELSNTADATTTALVASTKLDLSNVPIINEVAHGDASKLFDQQTASGDPRASMGGALSTDDPSTRWELGSSDIYLPASAVIDLGVETEISDIYVYDGNGSSVTNGPLTLSAGDPFNWQPLTTDSLTGYQQWNSHPVKATTRYLQVKRTTKGADAVEIVIYGTRLGTPEAQPQPAAQPPLPTMDQLIGINAFIDDRKDRMQVAGFVREYHNWDWDEGDLAHWGTIHTDYPGYPNNLNKFNPTYASSGGWNFDSYYDDLKNLGITVSPAIKESVSWMTISKHNKPIDSGQSALDPASYAAHGDHMFQYAARYGSTAVADSKLKLAADQPRSSGLGTLQYFEDWNEQDKWWEGRNSFFTPYEYAAMASADYDGDQRRMGDTFGVKNADPNAKLVMSGLADPNLDYIKALKFWSDWNRGGSVPFDVINIHHYSNNSTDQTTGTVGISPEADNLKTLLKKFVDYRNQYMPGKEVWITEFGYDINAMSVQRAPSIGNKSAQEVQGEWLVRSYLAASAAGIDKASMYMLRDVNPNSTTKFDSAGLTSTLGTQEVPKISWYYVYTLKNQLTGMRYDSEVASDNGNVRIYKYVNDANNKDVYVLWAPTSNDTVVTDYALALENAGTSVSLVTMEEGDTDGVTSALTVAGGTVSVDVSECPVFVVVDKSSANNGGSNNGGSNNGGSNNGGSNNGGSNNGGNTAEKVEAVPVVTKGSVQLKPQSNAQGAVAVQLTADEIGRALAGAADTLTVGVAPVADTRKISISLPTNALTSSPPAVAFNTGLAEVTFPAAELKRMFGGSDSHAALELTVEQIEPASLPIAAREQIGSRPVVDLKLTLGGTPVSRFGEEGGNGVQVRIPYKLQPGEAAHNVIIYYIANDGTLSVVTNGQFDAATGTVTFDVRHFSYYAVAYHVATFDDLAGAPWAQTAIEALAARDVVEGKGSSLYDPQGSVTRAEFVTMLVRTYGWQAGSDSGPDFSDVTTGEWYADAVNTAAGLRIVNGRGNGTFGVNDPITREEMALLLARALQLVHGGVSGSSGAAAFADTAALSVESASAIASVASAGLINGFPNGLFEPGEHATRAQAATVLYRALGK